MKTVVILSNEHSWTYNLRKETIQALLNAKYRVILILPYGEKVELLKEMGCHYYDVPMFERRGKNPITELKLIREYKRLLYLTNPDVVLTYTIKPNLYGGYICGRLHIPFIANITGLGTAVKDNGIVAHVTKWLYKVGLKHAECVFAQNKGSKNYLIKNKIVGKQRVKIIPGSGVNLDRFKEKEYPNDKVVKFVFISRILKEKGIEEYLEAATLVKKHFPDTEFHICGFCETEYKGSLQTKDVDGTIIYHGMIDNVPDFLAEVHCLVHPSYYLEGLSNVCLEACASGRPVITTDHEGCRETVIDKVTGYIIPIKDGKALAEAMVHFINLNYHEKKEMGLKARRFVEKKFDRKKIVAAYMKEISLL